MTDAAVTRLPPAGAVLGEVERDDTTAEWLDAARRGQLLIRRCAACGAAGGPQEERCAACGSFDDVGWEPASGEARIVSWSVVHHRGAGPTPVAPTITVIAELDEGPWWWSQIIEADPADLHTGGRLRVAFASAGEEMLPVFRLG